MIDAHAVADKIVRRAVALVNQTCGAALDELEVSGVVDEIRPMILAELAPVFALVNDPALDAPSEAEPRDSGDASEAEPGDGSTERQPTDGDVQT